MAGQFTEQEWATIENRLAQSGDVAFGLPARDNETVLLASWNIRKFGSLLEQGQPNRSAGAWRLIERFCARCDFLAIQEGQDDLASVRHLRDRLNAVRPGADYRIMASDLTGRAPGSSGLGERFAFLFDHQRVDSGEIASDLTFDQSEILKNINTAINEYRKQILDEQAGDSMAARALAWVQTFTGFYKDKLPAFFQFIRSPHLATFKIKGDAGHSYELACVNAHLLSGRAIEREREFFALLEWLLRRSGINGQMDAPITILLGDLNLDFKSDNDARRTAIEEYVVTINSQQSRDAARVNFPFLDTPPGREPIRSNSRENETFDHIAWFSNDDRFPRGRHNGLAGHDGFDYGMFNFLKLFREAGPGLLPNGKPAFGKFEHDVSDHMPIWVRLPVPSAGQKRYSVDG